MTLLRFALRKEKNLYIFAGKLARYVNAELTALLYRSSKELVDFARYLIVLEEHRRLADIGLKVRRVSFGIRSKKIEAFGGTNASIFLFPLAPKMFFKMQMKEKNNQESAGDDGEADQPSSYQTGEK